MNTTPRRPMAALLILALAAFGPLSACGSHSPSYYNAIKRTVVDAKDDLLGTRPTTAEFFSKASDRTPLADISEDAADDMLGFFGRDVNSDSPIYVKAFVNGRDPADPSPFGQVVADQVAARMATRGFRVTAGPVQTSQQPRPQSDAEKEVPPTCELTGDYIVASGVVYVNARITALNNGHVLAAQAWTVPMNRHTRALLRHAPGEGLKPNVATRLYGRSPHAIANPSGQPQNYVERNLVF